MTDASLSDANASGIYQIRNLVNGKRYIGSAVNIRSRWHSHRHRLRNGAHHSDHLQNAWNKYGENSFEFSILELCEVDSLIEREQFHIDNGCEYNKAPRAGSPLGVKWSQAAKERASARRSGVPKHPDHVEKMSLSAKLQWADQETRERMSNGIRRAYTEVLIEQRRSESKANWRDEGFASRVSAGIKRSYTPELRALRAEQSKQRWADPEFRARMIEIRRRRNA